MFYKILTHVGGGANGGRGGGQDTEALQTRPHQAGE